MLWIKLDRRSGAPLTQQLYDRLVSLILNRELAAGSRLPSTRELAASVGVSRNVVLEVFEQLIAEGYLEARQGSGTFVAKLALKALGKENRPVDIEDLRSDTCDDLIAFACGLPDLSRFPRARWLRCGREMGFHASEELWGYGPSFGCPELREEIRRHVALTKGIDCKLEQVVVTGGGAHGLAVLAMALRSFRSGAIIEDPTVDFVEEILRGAGHPIEAVPVDGEGIVVDALPSRSRAGMLVVSPAHQFPLGGTLTIQRRLALLEYARSRDLFVVEDDYDSEFRFSGAPVSALYRLDPDRSIHMGTFSKSLSPSIRLGYLALPRDLVPLVRSCLSRAHLSVSPYTQRTLARFMQKGYLRRHVSRMVRVYERKMGVLVGAIGKRFDSRAIVSGHSTGLHLVAKFEDVVFCDSLREYLRSTWRVESDAVHDYRRGAVTPGDALALGFGNLSEDQIAQGVDRLADGVAAWRSE